MSSYKRSLESPKLNSHWPHITFQLLPISHFPSYMLLKRLFTLCFPVLSRSPVVFTLPHPVGLPCPSSSGVSGSCFVKLPFCIIFYMNISSISAQVSLPQEPFPDKMTKEAPSPSSNFCVSTPVIYLSAFFHKRLVSRRPRTLSYSKVGLQCLAQ